jgi:SAM-dependent methyltransferase
MPEPAPLGVLHDRLRAFVQWRHEHLDGDEKGEAQLFLERLFQAFGYLGLKEAGATLEMRVARRAHGGTAFADLVWKPRLLLEMKKATTPLAKHYQQAFEYWIDLVPGRPQYVVLCNFDEFWIYDLNRQLDEPVDRVGLDDLTKRWEALGFMLPTPVAPVFQNDLEAVTRGAAETLVRVTNSLIERGVIRQRAQRFAMQALVTMVAEDIGLLPRHLFAEALESSLEGGSAYDLIFSLFEEMNRPGVTPAGRYAGVPYFNGGLFREAEPFDLNVTELTGLHHAASYDWSAIRPEIFGTLFEQSLGKEERHAFGAYFTSGADIQRVVLPTIVRPWRRRIDDADTAKELGRIEQDLLNLRVLDPACGCGNFLYIAYRELRKLEKLIHEKRVALSRRRTRGGPGGTAALSFVRPGQFFGIDINGFAVEIAKVTLMLGKQLAAAELGDEHQVLPLDDLDENFIAGDALFVEWPEFDVCIGNPPYLGRRRLVQERGAEYSQQLTTAYPKVGGVSDYVTYWFRKTHDLLPEGGRAGLVGTNTIRQTDTRKVSLDYIVDHGGVITDAWSSLEWSGEAAVYVSIVNWIKGPWFGDRTLWLDDGQRKVLLPLITGSLSPDLDLRYALSLGVNQKPKVFFQGQTPGHTKGFVMTEKEARALVATDEKSRQVLYPYIVGDELLHLGSPGRWVIDINAPDATAAKAQAPGAFERVRQFVLPDRKSSAQKEAEANQEILSKNPKARVNWHHRNFLAKWWQHSYRREEFLAAILPLDRFITLSATASQKRRPVYTFVSTAIHPSHAVQCFAFDDDYSLGILQSTAHEAWFRGRCSTLKMDLRYTPKTVFNSFPWPQDPSPSEVAGVVSATAQLLKVRESLLSAGLSLAQQYDSLHDPGKNELLLAHERLDEVVMAAYGFDASTEVLESLLDLNLRIAGREAASQEVRGPGGRGFESIRLTDYCVAAPVL